MAGSEFVGFLKKALPWIGAAATGNVPALITMAAKTVGDVLGTELPAEADAIAGAVANATPDQLLALRNAENDFKLKAQALGFQHAEEMGRQELERDKALIADTAHARQTFASDAGVFRLGVVILLTFAAVMGGCLWGAYQLLVGGIKLADVAVVAALFGFLGTVVGYVAANAQQVVSYFFGSSRGSAQKTDAMAEAVRGLGPTRRGAGG